MKALVFVEVDIEWCGLTFGVGDCPAVLGVDTPTKCFNSKGSCPVRASFQPTTVTLRFAQGTSYLVESGIDAIACIEDISFTAGTISLGEDLGTRSSLRVTMSDFPWSDTGEGFDKYLDERSYDPYKQGTFWGKFRARHPSLRGRAIRVIRGTLGQPLEEMETRHYVVESIDGPGRDGKYSVVAKDALKLLDGDRAQAPKMSNGYLLADINDSVTSATLGPSGIGNLEYPASGFAALGGKEIVAFTRSGDTLTLTRAQYSTLAVEHKATDRVQVCITYTSANIGDIINDLMVNYAAVPPEYITLSDWTVETTSFLGTLYTAVIAEPTAVETLIKELVRQGALAIWWDDINRQIRLRVLRQIDTSAALFDEDVFMEGTFAISDQPTKRLSQVWTYFAQIDPLRNVDDTDNFRSCVVVADLEKEGDYGAPAIEKIYSRWIPGGGRAIAQRIGQILVGRFGTPPRKFKFETFRDSPYVPVAGIGCRVSWPTLQDPSGARAIIPAQINRLDPQSAKYVVEAEEFNFIGTPAGDPAIIFDVSRTDVNVRSIFDLFYPTPESGDDIYIIVESGVIIGSSSISTPAMTIGTWPAGVNLHLVVRGHIQGAGGRGGQGAKSPGGNADNGQAGGLALYTRFAIEVENTGGIWGGGGGGGGGGTESVSDYGGGGGGGAGYLVGPAGSGGGISQGGDPGTPTAGGWGSGNGGRGGGPGLSGQNGFGSGGDTGGAAGGAIDGVSYITFETTGDIRGSQVN